MLVLSGECECRMTGTECKSWYWRGDGRVMICVVGSLPRFVCEVGERIF